MPLVSQWFTSRSLFYLSIWCLWFSCCVLLGNKGNTSSSCEITFASLKGSSIVSQEEKHAYETTFTVSHAWWKLKWNIKVMMFTGKESNMSRLTSIGWDDESRSSSLLREGHRPLLPKEISWVLNFTEVLSEKEQLLLASSPMTSTSSSSSLSSSSLSPLLTDSERGGVIESWEELLLELTADPAIKFSALKLLLLRQLVELLLFRLKLLTAEFPLRGLNADPIDELVWVTVCPTEVLSPEFLRESQEPWPEEATTEAAATAWRAFSIEDWLEGKNKGVPCTLWLLSGETESRLTFLLPLESDDIIDTNCCCLWPWWWKLLLRLLGETSITPDDERDEDDVDEVDEVIPWDAVVTEDELSREAGTLGWDQYFDNCR